jgi:hypothetical protein
MPTAAPFGAAVGVVTVFVPGLLYLLIARPYLRSKAPYSDAIEVAKKMRAAKPSCCVAKKKN